MSIYYLYLDDKSEGPFTRDEVDRLLEAGTISPATLFCQPGGEWNPVASMYPHVPATPPAAAVKSIPTTHSSTPPPAMVLDQLRKNTNPPSSALDRLRKNTNYPQAREWVIFLVTVAKGLNILFLIGALMSFIMASIGLLTKNVLPQEWYYGLISAIIFFCFWLIGLRLVKAMDQFLQMGIDAVDALVHMTGKS